MKTSTELEAEIIALSNEREEAIASFKERGLALTREFEEVRAKESNQTIAPQGVESEESVGETQ